MIVESWYGGGDPLLLVYDTGFSSLPNGDVYYANEIPPGVVHTIVHSCGGVEKAVLYVDNTEEPVAGHLWLAGNVRYDPDFSSASCVENITGGGTETLVQFDDEGNMLVSAPLMTSGFVYGSIEKSPLGNVEVFE